MDGYRENAVLLVQLLDLFDVPSTFIDENVSIDLVYERNQPLGNRAHTLLLSDLQHYSSDVLSARCQVPPLRLCPDNIPGHEYRNSTFCRNTRCLALAGARHSNNYDDC